MSIVLAMPVSGTRASHPELAAKGVTGFTVCAIGAVRPTGFPLRKQVAHEEYAKNIAMFVAATTRKTKLIATADGALLDPSYSLIPLATPPFVYAYDGVLTDDIKAKIMKKLQPFNTEFETLGSVHRFIIHNATAKLCEQLSEVCGSVAELPGHVVHVETSKTIKLLSQTVAAFLATNTYAAFQEEEDAVSISGDVDENAEEWGSTTSFWRFVKRHADTNDYSEIEAKLNAAIATQLDEREDDAQAIIDKETWSTSELLTHLAQPFNLAAILNDNKATFSHVPVAHPSLEEPSINGGSVGHHPKNVSGLVFPYHQGMNCADYNTLGSIFLEHFSRLLGNTTHDITNNVKTFKRNLEQIVTTQFGIIMSHIFVGIDLALKTQARLYLLMEGSEYLGFSLIGKSFVVSTPTKIFTPRPWSRVSVALAALKSHSLSLLDMAGWLSTVPLTKVNEDDAEISQTVTPNELDTTFSLLKCLQKRTISEKDMKEGFLPRFKGLSYKQNFRPLSAGHFLETMRCYRDPSSDDAKKIIMNCAIHIPINYHILKTDADIILATHGPEVFSPRSPKGSPIPVGTKKGYSYEKFNPTIKGKNRKETVETFGVPPEEQLERIILGRSPIERAVKEWDDFRTSGNLFFDPKERAQGSRGIVYTNRLKEDLQNILADISKDKETKVKAKKRGRNDEEDDEDAREAKKSKFDALFD